MDRREFKGVERVLLESNGPSGRPLKSMKNVVSLLGHPSGRPEGRPPDRPPARPQDHPTERPSDQQMTAGLSNSRSRGANEEKILHAEFEVDKQAILFERQSGNDLAAQLYYERRDVSTTHVSVSTSLGCGVPRGKLAEPARPN